MSGPDLNPYRDEVPVARCEDCHGTIESDRPPLCDDCRDPLCLDCGWYCPAEECLTAVCDECAARHMEDRHPVLVERVRLGGIPRVQVYGVELGLVEGAELAERLCGPLRLDAEDRDRLRLARGPRTDHERAVRILELAAEMTPESWSEVVRMATSAEEWRRAGVEGASHG